MKIIVDCDKCQGHALCASQASDVYELDEMGYNSMGEFRVKKGQEAEARLGAEWCPEGAIQVIEEWSSQRNYRDKERPIVR